MTQQFSPSQLRAARALLDWSRAELASQTGVSEPTIHRLENGMGKPDTRTQTKIRQVLETYGIEFLESDGVRRTPEGVQIFQGQEAYKCVLNDVYETLRDDGGEVLIAHVDENKFIDVVTRSVLDKHLERLAAANIKERLLVRKDDIIAAPLEAYHVIPEKYFSSYPFYIYKTKIALLSQVAPQKAIIINDERFADAARKLFDFIWDHTEMPVRKKPAK